jgi:DNA-binding response OmpR family regulator
MKRIIYVDDVNYALLSLKERLRNTYEVFPTQSVEKMYEILDRVNVDLILLDINMPEIDGYEAIKRLKDDRRYAHIPVMFLTAKRDRKSLVKGMHLGAIDFVAKPVSDDDLLECIEYHLNPELREADKPIILAVDDTPSILVTLKMLLGDLYTVHTMPGVSDERDFKTMLSKTTPDLFLLDYNMPTFSGFDLMPIIRGFRGHEETPVLFLTSDQTVGNITTAILLGARDYIVKPIDPTILHKKIMAHAKDFFIRRRIRALDNT